MVSRYGATRSDYLDQLNAWDEPGYRADQIMEGLFEQRRPLEMLTTLPNPLRDKLADNFSLSLSEATRSVSSDSMTTKWLWNCVSDGAQIETVLMRYANRATVCVSSQAGCAMGCTFCATGQAGFERHLGADEILEQVAHAAVISPQPITNVVYMGMGEPLANYESVWESVVRLHEDFKMSARHITISTVGVVPGMKRLAEEDLPVRLAVSLHAPNDELRAQLVPLNKRYPIADILAAAATVSQTRNRRVTFEYACIAGVNDDLDLANELGELLTGFPGEGGAHVNLIPLNPTAGFPGSAPSNNRMHAFARQLETHRVNTTIRFNRGTDIDAACGQLRFRTNTE